MSDDEKLPKYVYIATTTDRLETIVAIADTASGIDRALGKYPGYCFTRICRDREGGKRPKDGEHAGYHCYKVELQEGDDEDVDLQILQNLSDHRENH